MDHGSRLTARAGQGEKGGHIYNRGMHTRMWMRETAEQNDDSFPVMVVAYCVVFWVVGQREQSSDIDVDKHINMLQATVL